MELGPEHFRNAELPGSNIESLNTLNELNQNLMTILVSELQAGNKIYSVTSDYPEEGAISVSLCEPFYSFCDNQLIVYSKETDPHYNKQSYSMCDKPVHQLVSPL